MPRKKRVKHSGIPFEEMPAGQNLGIAARDESPAALDQFRAQFEMVVDFSVEGDNGAGGGVSHGLIAALEVDDLEPRGTERSGSRLKDSLLIGSAVNQRLDGKLNPAGIWRVLTVCEPRDSHTTSATSELTAGVTVVQDFLPAAATVLSGQRPAAPVVSALPVDLRQEKAKCRPDRDI